MVTKEQLKNKIIEKCKEKGYCYLDRNESNQVLSMFDMIKAKYDRDLPIAKNHRPYKWHKLILETRYGIWYINFTLNAIRSETFEEFYTARPDQIWR